MVRAFEAKRGWIEIFFLEESGSDHQFESIYTKYIWKLYRKPLEKQ